MTTLKQAPAAGAVPRPRSKGLVVAGWPWSTDHKVIGHMYGTIMLLLFATRPRRTAARVLVAVR